MIALFDQNRKYHNRNNTVLHLVSLQAVALVGMMEPSNSVPGRSDRCAQLLTA